MYVYGGTALGIVAPILYNRHIGFGDVSDGSPAREAMYWVASAVTAIPLSVIGGAIGYAAGISAVATSRIRADLKAKDKLSADDLECKLREE